MQNNRIFICVLGCLGLACLFDNTISLEFGISIAFGKINIGSAEMVRIPNHLKFPFFVELILFIF